MAPRYRVNRSLIRAVTRDDVGVNSVQLLVDGVAIATDRTAPYAILWNTVSVADGLHNLIALATDSSGNAATSNPVIVLVANEGGGGHRHHTANGIDLRAGQWRDSIGQVRAQSA